MSAAAKAVRKLVRMMINIIDIAVLIIIVFLIAADCCALWDSRQTYEWAKASNYEIYNPVIVTQSHSFEELRQINPDVFGWLTIYGTHIDYPIVQGPDNLKYVNTNALGRYSLSGAIFLDARCGKGFSDFSSIIYGHHMEKQAMFGEIGLFSQKEYFDTHRYGMLYYGEKEHGLEFLSFVHCDAYNTAVFKTRITEREAKEAYLDMLIDIAIHTRNVQIMADDRIILLSTCSAASTNGRDILVGRITDELYEDIFKADDTGKDNLAVDGLPGLWARLPLQGKMAVFALLLLLLLLSLIIIRK